MFRVLLAVSVRTAAPLTNFTAAVEVPTLTVPGTWVPFAKRA
jgi:hypothetical protein